MSLYTTQTLKTSATHLRTPGLVADKVWSIAVEAMTRFTWGPIRESTSSGKTSSRELTVTTPTDTFQFGEPLAVTGPSERPVVLHVLSETFWTRVALFTDLGLAEAFMYGEVHCEDMSRLLRLLIANREHLSALNSFGSAVLAKGRVLTNWRFFGDIVNSRANISAHYDLGNTVFAAFLSEDMNYSSAIFKELNGDICPPAEGVESLKDAQMRKMLMLLKKIDIQPGDRVLEVGTGWGSLSILAAQSVDCVIDTVTLSVDQSKMARERIEEAGLTGRITVHNMDFREIVLKPEWKGAFDRFISVEMMEHVGKDFMKEYWSVVDWALKPKTAVGVVQVITIPESRVSAYDKDADFCQKWVRGPNSQIFPGGYIPSLCFLLETMNGGSSGRLTTDSVINIGPHYARTLRSWKRKFLANWDLIIKQDLEDRYSLNIGGLDIFKRKWTYYFDYCEAAFATRSLGNHVIKFTREGNVDFGCDLTV